jgi:hypothetical protein
MTSLEIKRDNITDDNTYYVHVCFVLSSTSKQSECVQKKTVIMEQLESKLDAGLERAISAIVSWVKLHLQTEQKKTDFKPEGDIDTIASPVSSINISFYKGSVSALKKYKVPLNYFYYNINK